MLFRTKIDPDLVRLGVREAAQRFPGLSPVILVDQAWDGIEGEIVNCRETTPDALARYPAGRHIFIYACDQDDLALPFVKAVAARGDRFLPAYKGDPALYVNIDHAARRAIEDEFVLQSRDGYAKFEYGPYDFINIAQALRLTAHLPGSYVEVGCFRGSSAGIALRYLQYAGIRRDCWFLDVFEGFTYDAARASADAFWVDSHQTEGRDVIAERLATYQDRAAGVTVEVVKNNIVTDELPDAIGDICCANLDVDMYEAVAAGLMKLHARLVPGGIIVVEDAGHTPWLIGARLALDEFLATDAGREYTPVYMQSGQTYLIRRG